MIHYILSIFETVTGLPEEGDRTAFMTLYSITESQCEKQKSADIFKGQSHYSRRTIQVKKASVDSQDSNA